ncbi:MAG: efflux transporter periplasmic adaptor subunit, partial [Candidatus Competibacteraceae bacterium]|nr:efflux transporter periplasmic adaptor subunit [Candidatus Competibacteraceae bacterium]
RTFRVELEIPNLDGKYAAGISAEIRIPLETVPAHLLSPALLSLDEQGILGVKTVDQQARVIFHPVGIVRTAPDGVWVAGLPQQVRIITVGQGFVQPGERVMAIAESATTVDEALDTAPGGRPFLPQPSDSP